MTIDSGLKPYSAARIPNGDAESIRSTTCAKHKPSPIRSRLQRLGLFSLISQLLGSLGLLLISANCLLKSQSTDRAELENTIRFGRTLPIQYWIAVIGFFLSAALYGFSIAWIHLFDAVCSFRASHKSKCGLDYGRYLNSLPYAPVTNGLRNGFPGLLVLKYGLLAVGIGLNVAYKVFLYNGEGFYDGEIPDRAVTWEMPSMPGPASTLMKEFGSSDLSPLLKEGYSNGAQYNKRTEHFIFDAPEGSIRPERVILTSKASCDIQNFNYYDENWFQRGDTGRLRSWELVLVATLENDTWRKDGAPPTLIRNRTVEFSHIVLGTGGWGGCTSEDKCFDEAVVEYAIPEPGRFDITWAPHFEGWDCHKTGSACGNQDKNILGHLSYRITYGVMQIDRQLFGLDCSKNYDASGVSWNKYGFKNVYISTSKPSPDFNLKPLTELEWNFMKPWLDISTIGFGLSHLPTSPLDGITMFAKHYMTLVVPDRARADGPYLPPPLGPLTQWRNESVQFVIPAKDDGSGTVGRGLVWYKGIKGGDHRLVLYHPAGAWILLIFGFIGLITLTIRLVAGPPKLTSWAAQHLFLSMNGSPEEFYLRFYSDEDALDLKESTGYETAKPRSIFARLAEDGQSLEFYNKREVLLEDIEGGQLYEKRDAKAGDAERGSKLERIIRAFEPRLHNSSVYNTKLSRS